VTPKLIPNIEAASVSILEPAHPRYEVGLGSAQDQMIVIAHQHPRINKPSGLFASFTKGLNEHPAILIASDNTLSAVTSRHHMVHRALKLDSDLSRHRFNSPILSNLSRFVD
jgi:hypothetical protein